MSTNRLRLAAAIAVVPLALAACSSSTTPASSSDTAAAAGVTDAQLQGVQITVGDFFGDCVDEVGTETDASKAGTECQAMRILNNKFNAENEWGITVTREGGAEWASYYDAVNAAFAADAVPDILMMHEANIADYATRDLLLPLDDQYAAVGLDTSDMTAPAIEAISMDDTLFAVPLDEHGNLSHVNVDLMAEAGLVDADGNPTLPTSPEELMTQAAAFTAATGKQYIAWGNDFNIPFRIFFSLVAQQGEPVLAGDGTVNIDTPAGKNALTLISDLYSQGIADPSQDYGGSQQAFLNGDVGVLINGTWAVDQYNNEATFDYQATDFPTLYDTPAVWANSHTWVIPVQPDADPVKYRAAMEYALYMFENGIVWDQGSGHISVRPSVLSSAEYQALPQRENYIATADNAALVPQVVGWPGAENRLQQDIEGVWLQGVSVDAALAAAQADVEAQLAG